MSSLSKFSRIDKKINNILYHMKLVLVQRVIIDLIFLISNISKSFYKNKIKNNIIFKKIEKNPFLPLINESKQMFYYLYFIVIEEFYYIWSYEERDEMSNKILEQLIIIEEFTYIHFNLKYLDTPMLESIPLMILTKTKDQILFQFTYFIHMFFITYVKCDSKDIIQYNIKKCIENHLTYKNNLLIDDFIIICSALLSFSDLKKYKKTFDILDIINYMYTVLIDCNKYYNNYAIIDILYKIEDNINNNKIEDNKKYNELLKKFLLSQMYNFTDLLNFS